MKVSIVTPSFRNSPWLRLCIASVADQTGVEHEHIIQDACSDDGTLDWLPGDTRVKAFVEKDSGMYDAVNRGLKRASGEVLAYLNCDEQYLPGALQAVSEHFESHPDTDILLADSVIVNPKGEFVCCRKCLVPNRFFAWIGFRTITASLFFHRRLLDRYNLYFDTRWRGVSDCLWMHEALQYRLKFRLLRRYTSSFTETGENLSLDSSFFREQQLVTRRRPLWARILHRPITATNRLRGLVQGVYREKPFTYSIYTLQAPDQRNEFQVKKPTGIWWQRHQLAQIPFKG